VDLPDPLARQPRQPSAWGDFRDADAGGFLRHQPGKYGTVDAENELLKEAREKRFAFTEDSWWLPSSESEYHKGVEMQRKYEAAVMEGKAVFNMRSDDIYNLFMFILSNQVLDQPLGLLVQATEDVPYTELDDRIYYTQGVILVLRDFLGTMVRLYPVIREKGGNENIQIAFKEMERVCTFDPWWCCAAATIPLWPTTAARWRATSFPSVKGLNDVAQSIRR